MKILRNPFRNSGIAIPMTVVMLFALASAGCHSSRSVSKEEREVAEMTIRHGHGSKLGKKIAEEAVTWMGTPYKYAAAEKGKGTDCSGLVLRVYEDVAGMKLPRNSAKQAEFCKRLKKKDVQVGDLVFFATGKDPKKVSHVGIMLDEHRFVHASSRKGVVMSEIDTDYYQRTFLMFGRAMK